MPANLTKRSVVKHRTKTPYNAAQRKNNDKGGWASGTGANETALGVKGKGRSNGFHVGPKHAPDGAYLGRGEFWAEEAQEQQILSSKLSSLFPTAKKIKADLIEKAKIKKQFYTKVANQDQEDQAPDADLFQRDEGKFAPEARDEEEGNDILNQMRDRDSGRQRASILEKEKTPDERRKQQKKAKGKAAEEEDTPAVLPTRQSGNLTKEERTRLRQERKDRYHAQSGSQRGRERGQPNLGARMDLLLEKIKQG